MAEGTLDFAELLKFGGKSLDVDITELRHQLATGKGFSTIQSSVPSTVKPTGFGGQLHEVIYCSLY